MIKRISLLLGTALLAAMMMVATAAPLFAAQELPAGCKKTQGTVVCEQENPPGKSGNAAGDPDPGGTTTTTTTTKGNTKNFSPEPQGTGTKCEGPPGRCK